MNKAYKAPFLEQKAKSFRGYTFAFIVAVLAYLALNIVGNRLHRLEGLTEGYYAHMERLMEENIRLKSYDSINQSLTEQLQAIIDGDMETYIYLRFKTRTTEEDARRAVEIARCESGLRSNATNTNTNGSTDRGTFQLNSGGVGYGHNTTKLFNPAYNTETALNYVKDHGWGAWVCDRKI